MEDLKYYPGEPKEYTLREITERVNDVENQAILIDPVSGAINPAGAGAVRGAVMMIQPSGSDDTAAINAALLVGRTLGVPVTVRGVPGKRYYISDALVLQSDGATLDMTSCYVDLLAGNQKHMVTTRGVVSPDLEATDAATTSGSNVITTALAATATVGQFACVYGAGPAGSELIGEITAKTSGTITLSKLHGPAANAASSMTGKRIVIVTPLSDIAVIGGTWNRGANGPNGGPGVRGSNVNGHSIFIKYFKNARVDIEGAYSTGGISFVWPTVGKDIYVKVAAGQAVRTICQVVGPIYRGHIEYISGGCNDDLVNLCGNVYDEQTDTAGDVIDVTVGVLCGRNVGGSALKLNACNGWEVRCPTVEALTGSALNMFFAGEDTNRPETTGGRYGSTKIGSIGGTPLSGGKAVYLLSPDGLNLEANIICRSPSPVYVGGTSASSWIERLDLKLDLQGDNKAIVTVQETAQIKALETETTGSFTHSSGTPVVVLINGASTVVNRIRMGGDVAYSGTIGDSFMIIAGTVGDVCIEGTHKFPLPSGENHVAMLSGGTIGSVVFDGVSQDKGSAMMRLQAGCTLGGVVIGDNRIVGADRYLNIRAATTLHVSGASRLTGLVNVPILSVGANVTVVGGGSVEGYSGSVLGRSASEVLTVNAPNLKADIAILARVDGSAVQNTNAAATNGTDGAVGVGRFQCIGTSTGSWKKVGTAGGSGAQY